MTRARDLANIADGTFTATDLDLSGTLSVSGDATFDTNTLFVDVSTDRVGMGTTTPSYKLDVNGVVGIGGSTDLLYLSGRTGTHAYVSLGASNTASDFYIGSDTAIPLIFRTSATERMRIDSSGKVGIGTTSPSEKLQVNGNIRLGSTSTTDDDAEYQITSGGQILIAANNAATQNTNFVGAILQAGVNPNRSSVNAFGSSNTSFNRISFDTANTERMRITSGGNVGIGTTSPSAFMHVEAADGTAGGAIKYTATGIASGYMSADAAGLCLATDTAGITFRTGVTGNDPTDTGSERLRIDSSGNVGIGNTSPGSYDSSSRMVVGGTSGNNSLTILSGSTDFGQLLFANGTGSPNIFNGLIRYDHNSNYMAFYTNGGQERARIDSSGNLLVGTTSQLNSGKISSIAVGANAGAFRNNNGAGIATLYVQNLATSGTRNFVEFVSSTTTVGTISTNGLTTTYNTSSDARLKENIADAEDAGAKVDAIQVRQFDWKADGSHQDYGMIAQELLTVAPEAVSGDPESDDMMGVDYSKLVPMLVKEIQSLRARVAQLEGA